VLCQAGQSLDNNILDSIKPKIARFKQPSASLCWENCHGNTNGNCKECAPRLQDAAED